MPGLMDLHSHSFGTELLPAFLYFGVTTVRDRVPRWRRSLRCRRSSGWGSRGTARRLRRIPVLQRLAV
jgi:hypothetical protein